MLAHPDIIAELARIIRKTIIEISKQSDSREDRQTKQSKIYALVNSQGFRRYLESVDEIHKKLCDLQKEERKDHEKDTVRCQVWKKEKTILEKLRDTYVDISTGIDAIIDGQDLPKNTEQPKDLDEVNKDDLTSLNKELSE